MTDLPSVTTIIKASGIMPRYKEGGGHIEVGTAVDLGSRFLFEGYHVEDLELDPRIVPYLESLEKWLTATGFQAEHIQPEFVSKKYGYVGHPDVIGGFDLWDIKTGSPARWHCLQTIFYAVAANEQDSEWIQRRGSIYAQKDGSIAKVHVHRDNVADWAAALSALKLYEGEKALEHYRENLRNWMKNG